MVQVHLGAHIISFMTILKSLSTNAAKPGMSFSTKGVGGFQTKLHTAMERNTDRLGVLKGHDTVLGAIHSQVEKYKHYIRRGGVSKNQAELMVAKITHEVHTKGEHLTPTQHEALKKLSHHLTKMDLTHRNAPGAELAHHQGTTSILGQQHTSSVHQIGDQTRISGSGEAPHASGGIANLIKNKNLPTDLSGPSSPPKPPRIKLSI